MTTEQRRGKKKIYYGLYLIGMACLLYLGAVFSDGVLHIANIYNFVDMATLAVIVVPCAFLLFVPSLLGLSGTLCCLWLERGRFRLSSAGKAWIA